METITKDSATNVSDLLADRIGSARNTLKDDPRFAEMFKELSPEEKSHGRLVGKLLEQGLGLKQINDVFTWWEHEHNQGKELTIYQRGLALFQALLHIRLDDVGYRAMCKLFAQANHR